MAQGFFLIFVVAVASCGGENLEFNLKFSINLYWKYLNGQIRNCSDNNIAFADSL